MDRLRQSEVSGAVFAKVANVAGQIQLNQYYSELSGTLPVAYPDSDFAPDGVHAEVSILYRDPTRGLGASYVSAGGILQISIVTPDGAGAIKRQAIADKFYDLLGLGTVINTTHHKIEVQTVSIAPDLTGGGYSRTILSIQFVIF